MTTDIRALKDIEKASIPPSIAGGIDLDLIEVHSRRWTPLTPRNVTVVRGYKIFYPNSPHDCHGLGHLAHIVHEVVHVWHYNHLGVGLYSPRWLDRRYDFELNEGDIFQDFGLEQQASLAEDLFRGEHGMPYRHAQNAPSVELLKLTVENCDMRRDGLMA